MTIRTTRTTISFSRPFKLNISMTFNQPVTIFLIRMKN